MKPNRDSVSVAALRSNALLAKALVPPAVTVFALWVFRDQFQHLDFSGVSAALSRIPLPAWFAALGLSALCYVALGRFDSICHRVLATGVPKAPARRSGMAALAISQTLGAGLVTGAVARWRLLPGLTVLRALAMSGLVSVTFMTVWCGLVAFLVLTSPDLPGSGLPVDRGMAGLLLVAGLVTAFWPRGLPSRLRLRLERHGLGPKRVAGMVLWACLDMCCAGLALYVLSGGADVPLNHFLPAFVIALGLGLLSGTPAGLGSFEVILLALLPQADMSALLAGIVGYRLVYFALPALAGLVVLAWPDLLRIRPLPLEGPWSHKHEATVFPDAAEDAIAGADYAEAQLARQEGLALLWSSKHAAGAVMGRPGNSLVLLRDPFPADQAEHMLDGLEAIAAMEHRRPCLYKCSARTAVLARRRGYETVLWAEEATLCPAAFDPSTRSRRQLRRKMRQAEKAGVRVVRADTSLLPFADMARINALWRESHSGERGFSMGRFCRDHLKNQIVFLAWQNDRLVGFVSFHHVEREWALDLMRPAPDSPMGTAHLMIATALRDAAAQGVPSLSLSAAPVFGSGDRADPLTRLRRRLADASGGIGLRRFKEMFDPEWQSLYLAAPKRLTLIRSALEIGQAISGKQPRDKAIEFGRKLWQRPRANKPGDPPCPTS